MKVKLDFIAAHAAQHAVRLMCRVLSVSPSWFHAWRVGAPKRAARHAVRDALAARIREIFERSKRRYGAPRIHAELVAQGVRIARKTVAKSMRENGFHPPRRRRRIPQTTDSRHSLGIAPNLLKRDFHADAPDQVWLADISYVPTDEGWLYLAAVKGEPLATIDGVDGPAFGIAMCQGGRCEAFHRGSHP